MIRSRIIQKLSEYGHQPKIYEIKQNKVNGIPTEEALQDGSDLLICAGGDGTINHTAQKIIQTSIPLGIIPLGSGNGLARTLRIPLDMDASIAQFKEPKITKIDTGKVNGDLFLISVGFGLDADIAHDFEKTYVRGMFPYIVSGIRRFFSEELETYRITDLDTKESWEGTALVTCVTNSEQFGGGAIVAPGASPTDGYLELLEGLSVSFPEALKIGVNLFRGRLDKEPKLIRRRIKRIQYERLSNRTVMHRDGEACFSEKSNLIEIDPLSLHVVVSEKFVLENLNNSIESNS